MLRDERGYIRFCETARTHGYISGQLATVRFKATSPATNLYAVYSFCTYCYADVLKKGHYPDREILETSEEVPF